MKRGEVWWYEHPEAGRRPYVVLTRTEACAVLRQVLAAPLTSVVRGIPTEVELDPSDGVPRACAVNLDNASPVWTHLLTERICELSPTRMAEVCDALAASTDC